MTDEKKDELDSAQTTSNADKIYALGRTMQKILDPDVLDAMLSNPHEWGVAINSMVNGEATSQHQQVKPLPDVDPPPGIIASPPAPAGDRGGKEDPLRVQLMRTEEEATDDEALWAVIRDRTNAISFNNYKRYMDGVMCDRASDDSAIGELQSRVVDSGGGQRVRGRDAFKLLKTATEAFLMQEAGLVSDSHIYRGFLSKKGQQAVRDRTTRVREQYLEELGGEGDFKGLPYYGLIRDKLSEIPIKSYKDDRLTLGTGQVCYGILPSNIQDPCLVELIWSYWHEEGSLIQTMKAVNLRFQNKRAANLKNPLERLATDPLRPLNNLLWGFIEGEGSRLSLARRAYEYVHEYGLSIEGRAVPKLTPVESRTGFLRGFHTLLHLCADFFKEDDDATIYADGFPLLNALKEVHLTLARGAHNQYGDLPWVSRAEMLSQMWLLARPEMREFLGGRIMVPYQETWMGRVDTMRRLQAWGDQPINHYRDLAVFGEQILLSIRFGNWSVVHQTASAVNWAKYWRNEIQSYIHSYRSLTGVDLTGERVDSVPPSVHLRGHRTVQSGTGN